MRKQGCSLNIRAVSAGSCAPTSRSLFHPHTLSLITPYPSSMGLVSISVGMVTDGAGEATWAESCASLSWAMIPGFPVFSPLCDLRHQVGGQLDPPDCQGDKSGPWEDRAFHPHEARFEYVSCY